MDGVSEVANLIGAPSTRHQTEEARSTGENTKKDDKAATNPSEAHPRMDARRLVPKRGSADQSEAETMGECSGMADKGN